MPALGSDGAAPGKRTGIAVQLGSVEIRASGAAAQDISPTKEGVSTQISDTLISRIPLLNRSFTDLAKLTPQP